MPLNDWHQYKRWEFIWEIMIMFGLTEKEATKMFNENYCKVCYLNH